MASAYSQQQASGLGWTWQRASRQFLSQEGPRRVQKGIRESWKLGKKPELHTEQAWPPPNPKHPCCCLVQLRGSWWGQLPARDLCCTEPSTHPPHGTGELREQSWIKTQLRHLVTVFQHPRLPHTCIHCLAGLLIVFWHFR